MTFNPAIPGATDLISQSQAQIQTNFSQADTAFGIDHTPFSTLANQGQHKQLTLIAPISNPNQAGNISSVYTKTSGTGVELFYQHGTANNGVSQLTGGGVTAAAWCVFDGTAGSPIAPGASFNVTNITKTGTTYTINFTRSFSSSNYVISINPSLNVSQAIAIQVTASAASCDFVLRLNGVASSAGNRVSVTCFGVLA